MNEEEILEKVNWAICVNSITKELNGDITSINVNVLQGLLDLYNKEKEENTFLEKQNDFLSKQYEEMFDDLNNVVSKDKIKAKIEYLKTLDFGTELVTQSTANLTTICILSELLEDK